MLTIDISSDIDAALRDVRDTFEREIPFVMASALTDTAFDVRRRVVGSTYPNAFEVRNKALPGRMFRVMDETGGVLRGGVRSVTRALKATGVAEISVGDELGRDWSQRNATGGTKTARGGTIAVPTEGDNLRGVSGRVLKRNKPLAIVQRKNHFLLKKGGRKVAIMQRRGKDTTAVYLFMNSAQIPKRFRFYEDAEDTTLRVFSGHFDSRFARVIRTSRFT